MASSCRHVIKAVLSVILLSLSFAQAQSIQLLNLTSTNSNVTSTCQSVANQQVSCNSTIQQLGVGYGPLNSIWIYGGDLLAGLCTSGCTASLSNWIRRIEGACSGQTVPMSDGTTWYVARMGEVYNELYSQACIKSPSGQFCNTVYGSAAGIDPMDQKMTRSPASTIACNSCFLSILSTQLQMPLASGEGIASVYSSLTSSCHSTSMSVKPISTTLTWTVTTATSTGTATQATCAGTQYTIKAGDTCQSISKSQGISTMDLLAYNTLQAACYQFPTSGTLCIPSSRACTPYTVQSGDTCRSIASSLQKSGKPISFAQIVSWNPAVGGGCSRLADMVGMAICVSTPGGASGPSLATPPVSPTTSGSTLNLNVSSWTPFSMLPTYTMAANSSAGTVIPYADGTRTNCARYLTAPILTNSSANTTSSSCGDAAAQYGANLSDFLQWNPSLNASVATNCTLSEGYQYCARPYDTLASATQYCSQWDITMPGLSCEQFANIHGVELDQFVSWNDDVGKGCEHFNMGTQYCVAVRGYRQPGIVSSCNQFAMANQTNWVDQPCQILETKFGLSHARFVAWNPALGTNCTGIYPFYDYCVSIPGYKPTYSTITSTTASVLTESNDVISTKTNTAKLSTAGSVKPTSIAPGVSTKPKSTSTQR